MRTTIAAAIRGLRSTPGLSLAVVLTFALGIGANASVYEILDRLLLTAPPHIEEPDDLVRLAVEREVMGAVRRSSAVSFVDVEGFRASQHLEGVAGYARPRRLTIGRGENAERVAGAMATADFFPLLGVQPLLGRFFTEAEDAVGAPGVAVLGEGYWRRSFGGSHEVLGRTIDFGHGEYVVVGVAPRGFTGINLEPADLWLPIRPAGTHFLGGAEWLTSGGYFFVHAVGRLAHGSTRQQVAADATRLHRIGRAEQSRRGSYDPEARVVAEHVIAARGDAPEGAARVARWLGGVSVVVLLIACLNVANLLLARSLRHRRATAIRLALGVSRLRLIGTAVTESMVLALLGGIGALAASRWAGDIVRTTLLPDVDWTTATLNLRFVVFVFVLALIAGVVSALVPAVLATRSEANDALRSSAGAITRTALRTRGALSLVQTGLSVLLLVGAGLFVRSLSEARSTDLGFQPANLLAATVVTDGVSNFDDETRRDFFQTAADRVQRLPFVLTAAVASAGPMLGSYTYSLRVPGVDSVPGQHMGGLVGHAVTPGYFETLGIRVLRGRALGQSDRRDGPAVIVVNQAFADVVWPRQDALGKCVFVDADERPHAPCAHVVGVVATARRDAIAEIATAQFYVPLAQRLVETGPNILFVRVTEGGEAHTAALRSVLLGMEDGIRDANVQPLLDFAASELRPWRLGATLFTLFGAIALIVAALGLYSVLAFDVAQRVREIGLRSALGARLLDIVQLVVVRAIALTSLGIAAGLAAALLLAPRLGELLYEVDARDPFTFSAVAGVLLLVAIVASAIPAARAALVNPNVALRSD